MYRLEPNWRSYHCLPRLQMPNQLLDWLLYVGSMTARKEAFSQQPVHVRVRCHRWTIPRRSEQLMLNLHPNERAIVREVDLLCNDQPYMFARSVFPAQSLLGRGWKLRTLGARPLGKFMFASPMLTRDPFQVACLRSGHKDFQRALGLLDEEPDHLWARRSIFRLTPQQPLLVSEVFLPCLHQNN